MHGGAAEGSSWSDRFSQECRAVSSAALRHRIFSTLRKFTADGFVTGEIGMKYLGYIGNTYLSEFPGCPPLPEH